MNENLINELEKSKFGNNKYYQEIIKEFISIYDESRVTINDNLIEVKANDQAGSRNIYFVLNELNRLVVKVDRNVDLIKFQDIIVYDAHGIMMERTNAQAELKKELNKKFKDNPNVLIEEFSELGQHPSIYTGQIFKNIRLKKIKRAENFDLTGLYTSKVVSYDDSGLMDGKIIEGTFNVLNSSSISSLEFPNEEDITITNEELLDDNNIYDYPNSRSL